MNGPSVLGIVGCQVLEDEMAYVVATDPDTEEIMIIDSTVQKTITDKIKRMAPRKKVKCIDETCAIKEFQLPSGMSTILWIKPIGLHQSPPLLREEVMKAINRIEPLAKSILLFYGQCEHHRATLKIVENSYAEAKRLLATAQRHCSDCRWCDETLLSVVDAFGLAR